MKNLIIGVNLQVYRISDYQNRHMAAPPNNYISDSFKIFAENGLNCITIAFYWESYEKDPEGFKQELDIISKEADKYNTMCIYDNHQWERSSFLGHGIGFPNSIMSNQFSKETILQGFFKKSTKSGSGTFFIHSTFSNVYNMRRYLLVLIITNNFAYCNE